MVLEFFHVFHVESDIIDLISICKRRYRQIFFTYRKHQFIKLVILQIPKNLDLSMSNNRKQFVGPSTSKNEKNIGRPPLHTFCSRSFAGYLTGNSCVEVAALLHGGPEVQKYKSVRQSANHMGYPVSAILSKKIINHIHCSKSSFLQR